MKVSSRRGGNLWIAALVLSLLTGCSGNLPDAEEDGNNDDDAIESAEDAGAIESAEEVNADDIGSTEEAVSKADDKQGPAGFTASTYIGDNSGSETLYSTIKYTYGIPVESYTDVCALYNSQGMTEFLYYVITLSWNSHGDRQTSEIHYVTDDIDAKTETEYEYVYNLSGNPVSATGLTKETSEEEAETVSLNLTMTYSEDDQLRSVSITETDMENGEPLVSDLNLQFAENAVYRVMTVEYEGETFNVTYKFDADGNTAEISCDGGLPLEAISAIEESLICSMLQGYADSYLTIIMLYGGSVSYQYNEEGDCIYKFLDSPNYVVSTIENEFTYEYTYGDDGNLSRKIQFMEDYFLVTYYEYE